MRFVRYQAATANHRGHHVGVFGPANGLAADGRLSEQEHRWWSESNAWFDQAHPDLAASNPELFNRRDHPLVSCWFKTDALHLIERAPGHLQLLDAHRVPWRRVLSNDPGRVLYKDEVQIVVAPG